MYYAIPNVRRLLYLGWMRVFYPIGWVVSHLLLAIVYYLVLTPIGLVMRLFGGDPMHRGFDRSAKLLVRPSGRNRRQSLLPPVLGDFTNQFST